MQNWKHAIAAILLVGAFTLRGLGVNSVTEYIIIAVALVYLGVDIRSMVKPSNMK